MLNQTLRQYGTRNQSVQISQVSLTPSNDLYGVLLHRFDMLGGRTLDQSYDLAQSSMGSCNSPGSIFCVLILASCVEILAMSKLK